jgi:hypothetical protein
MSWIQENKFVAGLVGVTAVVGGAILFYGYSQGSAYDQKMLEYEDLKSKHTSLEKSKPYPDADNLKKRQDGIKQYTDVIDDVRTALVGYQPGKLVSLTPEQFSDAQVKMEKELRTAFETAGTTLPDGCNFGFEKYADVQAKAGATAQLNYQLGAMRWLLGKLAEVKPQGLANIKRTQLPVEVARVTPAPAPPRRGGRAGGNGRAQTPTQAVVGDKPYQLMPVELAFTTSEASLRDFLKAMVNSEKYFFSIRAVRLRNERQTPPSVKDADFPDGGGGGVGAATPAGADPFGDIVFPGDDAPEGDEGGAVEAPAPVADGSRILKQVLGSEKVHVYLSFDILLIKGEKADAAASPEPSDG